MNILWKKDFIKNIYERQEKEKSCLQILSYKMVSYL